MRGRQPDLFTDIEGFNLVADPREIDDSEEISPRHRQVHAWADDPRVSATERRKILSEIPNLDDPSNGERGMRRARDIYSKAVLSESDTVERRTTLLVNRVLDPLLKCGSTYKGLDVADVAAAIKADPTSVEDFLAAAKVAYDVLETVDTIAELVSGRRTAFAS
ncbi:hypothetical protein [Leifsonia shinshuensis]|uniref:Uncharacterized protein n=1 Tax=Leifsonia shinshuensis TaxID=150026 RepID=A0A7G6YHF5_9MICO|nr:hypothetical protein [Leifsonia shinshuensis]QNE37920.1 hypothetical protein F1C12_21800 [Leifsonia shinshuensis]